MSGLADGRHRVLVLMAGAFAAVLAWSAGLPAEEVGEEPGTRVIARYDRGFLLATADDRFQLRLNGAIHFRYLYADYDNRIKGNEANYSNFYMRRARLYFQGHAFDPRFTYFIHLQLEPNRSVNAHDIWLEYDFGDLLKLGAGRNKVAYGLEFLNSGLALNLVERSVMYGMSDLDTGGGGATYPGGGTAPFNMNSESENGYSTGGLTLYRSQGVQLRGMKGSPERSTWEYQVGVWQGRRTTGRSNSQDDHMFSARVGFSPLGWIDWKLEGAGDNVDRFRVGVFLSAYKNRSDRGGGFHEHGANLAVQSRYRGFSADAEWGFESFDFDAFADDFNREGWRLQSGLFLVPTRFEVVARYAEIKRLQEPTYRKSMDSGLGVAQIHDGNGGFVTGIEARISEATLGVNYYINLWHRHKIQAVLTRLVRAFAADPEAGISRPDDQVDLAFAVQVSLVF